MLSLHQDYEDRLNLLFTHPFPVDTPLGKINRLQYALSLLLFEHKVFERSIEETELGLYFFRNFDKYEDVSFKTSIPDKQEFGYWIRFASLAHDVKDSLPLALKGDQNQLRSFVASYDGICELAKSDLFSTQVPNLARFFEREITHTLLKNECQDLLNLLVEELPKSALWTKMDFQKTLFQIVTPFTSQLQLEISKMPLEKNVSGNRSVHYKVKKQINDAFASVQYEQEGFYVFLYGELEKLCLKNRRERIGYMNDLYSKEIVKLPVSLPKFEPHVSKNPFVDALQTIMKQQEPLPEPFSLDVTIKGYTLSVLKEIDSQIPLYIDHLAGDGWKGKFLHSQKKKPDFFSILPAEWSEEGKTKRGFFVYGYSENGICFYRKAIEYSDAEILNKIFNPEFHTSELKEMKEASLEKESIAKIPPLYPLLEISSSYTEFLDGEKNVTIFSLT